MLLEQCFTGELKKKEEIYEYEHSYPIYPSRVNVII
jgi:hypothetical protein